LTTLKYFEIKFASPDVKKKKKGKTVYNQFALLKLYKTQLKQQIYVKRKIKGNKNHSPASPLMCKHNDRS